MTSFDDDYVPDATLLIRRKPAAGPGGPVDVIGHFLVTQGGPEPAAHLEILEGTPITMGRDARQTLVLNETGVSRQHARVLLIHGEVVAHDLGSTNGTFVDEVRITEPTILREGSLLQVGSRIMRYVRRSKSEMARAEELERDLAHANAYVHALLPAPLTTGAVRAHWQFIPSTQLGGDAFGYYWLDPGTFVFYLVDVCGHGASAAMHSVTVLNLLRQRALPLVDFTDPADVLFNLNNRFQMDNHGEMYFTMWYGVYRTASRTLSYSAAGHHAAYLISPDKATSRALGAPELMIGAMPGVAYSVDQAVVPTDSSLYLFSDGVFEIVTTDQKQWGLPDFVPLLSQPSVPGTPEAERLYQAVTRTSRPGPLDDDFSLVVFTFV
jgi:serine phosphatase RsbU (regulator of sigma subunit)